MCCGILLGLPTTAQSNTSAERSQQLILLHSTFTYALPALGMGYRILYYYVCAGPQGKSILKQTKGFVRAGASHENQSSDRGRKKIILFLVALGFPPAGLLWSGEFFKPQLARWLQKTCATESASQRGWSWVCSDTVTVLSSATGSSDVLPRTTPGETVQLFWTTLFVLFAGCKGPV